MMMIIIIIKPVGMVITCVGYVYSLLDKNKLAAQVLVGRNVRHVASDPARRRKVI